MSPELSSEAAELTADLSPEQYSAVTSTDSPLIIIAPAGSGKTRVLTRRIAYRIRTGIARASQTIAVSFTRASAWEMTRRLDPLLSGQPPRSGTFHSLALNLLRQRSELGDRWRIPQLLTNPNALLSELAPQMPRARQDQLWREIEWAQALGVSPNAYPRTIAQLHHTTALPVDLVAETYAHFAQEKERRNLADFADILRIATELLEAGDRFSYAARLGARHFFVDEFQDINPLQLRFLTAWIGTDPPDLTVVGDPNQAIYGWNGADPQLLASLPELFDGTQTLYLNTNYRSTPEVLQLARSVLPNSTDTIRPTRNPGPEPVFAPAKDADHEAVIAARTIRSLHQRSVPYRQMAVLARTVKQLHPIAARLRDDGIPHSLPGRSALHSNPVTQAILRTLTQESMGITAICDYLEERLALIEPRSGAPVSDQITVIQQLLSLASEVRRKEPEADLGLFRELVINDRGRSLDVVTLTTFHRSKGLEWFHVHIIGASHRLLPHPRARTDAEQAEEARLLYVALTRSTTMLTISWPAGSTGAPPSKLLVRDDHPPRRPASPTTARKAPSPSKRSEQPSNITAHRSSLDAWRRLVAHQRQISPTLVLSDRELDRLLRRNPTTPGDVAEELTTSLARDNPMLIDEVLERLRSPLSEQSDSKRLLGREPLQS
ncbi:MAG: UvrD-helicase domain-containing protein [Ferrimicrobium sp.]